MTDSLLVHEGCPFSVLKKVAGIEPLPDHLFLNDLLMKLLKNTVCILIYPDLWCAPHICHHTP